MTLCEFRVVSNIFLAIVLPMPKPKPSLIIPRNDGLFCITAICEGGCEDRGLRCSDWCLCVGDTDNLRGIFIYYICILFFPDNFLAYYK